MADPDNKLILENLKKIQAGIADLRLRSENVEEQLSSIRHILVAMQTDDLHQEARITGLRADVDAIKQHLHLSDA
jgi:hypothetical protein